MNHFKADIISKANETMWHPENGFSKNAKPFHLPWKVVGDTVADAVTITLNLKKENLGNHCPKTDSGMTVQFNYIVIGKYFSSLTSFKFRNNSSMNSYF